MKSEKEVKLRIKQIEIDLLNVDYAFVTEEIFLRRGALNFSKWLLEDKAQQ